MYEEPLDSPPPWDGPPDKATRKTSLQRIGGYLHRVTPVFDSAGKLVHVITTPLRVELRFRDLMQMAVGAAVFALPVAITGEVWELGHTLPMKKVYILLALPLILSGIFNFFQYYENGAWRGNLGEFFKRTISAYIIAHLVAAGFLYLLDQAPWASEPLVAFKQLVIVGFAATLSATVSDALK